MTLTTPINPVSVSVCFTVTWMTGLGLFRVNIVMATLSGAVLLFLFMKSESHTKPKLYVLLMPSLQIDKLVYQEILTALTHIVRAGTKMENHSMT